MYFFFIPDMVCKELLTYLLCGLCLQGRRNHLVGAAPSFLVGLVAHAGWLVPGEPDHKEEPLGGIRLILELIIYRVL